MAEQTKVGMVMMRSSWTDRAWLALAFSAGSEQLFEILVTACNALITLTIKLTCIQQTYMHTSRFSTHRLDWLSKQLPQ